MKVIIALALVIAVVGATPVLRHEEFEQFKTTFGKSYHSAAEQARRLSIFSANKAKMEAHNELYERGLTTYTMGVNQFSDLTKEEFVAFLKLSGPKPEVNGSFWQPKEGASVPASIDWRSSGAVTPVKDQGQCGSCWSFSTTGAIESSLFLKTKQLLSLSEQTLVDCDTTDYGCDGGWPQDAMQFVINNGLPLESQYPYTAVQGTCQYSPQQAAARISSYQNVAHDEASLQQAVGTVGPVSIAVDASGFQSYSGGVFYDPSCSTSDLDHAILAVGYGSDGQNDYWIVKNSWGVSWGEQGYIRMIRNHNNNCGVASSPVIAIP